MKLEKLSGVELGQLVNDKEISPVEVISYFQNVVESKDSAINAFTYTKFDDALNEAKKLEDRLMRGEKCGPFAGVPVGLKDFLPSKRGWTNSHGGVKSLICEDVADSEFYRAANTLGAIAIGKTNAPAFGFSGACQNNLYGATKNPFDVSVTSGGSSGGTAAAVASGMIIFGEGGDAGGSIRVPSSWCNLFGFKPSIGTVPSYCRPDGWSATHPYCFNGSLTKTVLDSATMLNEMAQYNPRDPISLPINSNKDFTALMKKPIKDWKIGYTRDFNLFHVDSKVSDKVIQTARCLEAAGAHVDEVKFNFKHVLDEIMFCWAWAISVDTAIDLSNWKLRGLDLVRDHADELPEEFIKFNTYASNCTIFDMRVFNEIRTDILDNFEDAFEQFDIIVSPTTCCEPFPISCNGHIKHIGDHRVNPSTDFISFAQTPLCNFIGYPAASVPAGLTDNKLPVGIQVIGKQYKDEDVFAVADKIEQIQPWNELYPYL